MSSDERPSSAIVRLRTADGGLAGSGFLVTGELIVTCAHVLGPTPPTGTVTVEFPLAGGVTAEAAVTGWTPIGADGSGDIAVLRFTSGPPEGVRPARLTALRARWGDPVHVFGFPADLGDLGAWVAAEVRDRQGAGWLQVETTTAGRVIEPGYSGAPAWSPAVGGVIGMVVAADRGAGHATGYLVPVPALVAAHPALGAPDPTDEPPYRGLEPFLEEHARAVLGPLVASRLVVTGDEYAELAHQALIDRWPRLAGRGPRFPYLAGGSAPGPGGLGRGRPRTRATAARHPAGRRPRLADSADGRPERGRPRVRAAQRRPALQPADHVFPGMWSGKLDRISTARGGDLAVITNASGLPAVWRGLTGDRPVRVRLGRPDGEPTGGNWQISPSGRVLAYANPEGGVVVWDLDRPETPRRFAPEAAGPDPSQLLVRSISFNSDETRVVVLRADTGDTRSELRAWTLGSGAPVPVAASLTGGRQINLVLPGPRPGAVVLRGWRDGIVLAELSTGRVLRSYPGGRAGLVAGGGSLVADCDNAGIRSRLRGRELAGGRQLRSIDVPACTMFMDATSSYLLLPQNRGATNAYFTVVDPRSGRAWPVVAPPVDLEAPAADVAGRVVVSSGPDDRPVLLAGDDGQVLYRLRPQPSVTLRPNTPPTIGGGRARVISRDGRWRLRIGTAGGLEVFAATSERLVASAESPPPPGGWTIYGLWFGFTEDGRRLVMMEGDEMVVRRMPGLEVERRIAVPVPPDLGPPPEVDGVSDRWAGSVLPGTGDDVIVLHAGVFTRWNLATGVQTGTAVPLRTGDAGARRRAATLAFAPARRHRHPDQVAVVVPDGTVQIWDVARGRPVLTVPIEAKPEHNAIRFDTRDERMAVQTTDGQVELVTVDDPSDRRVIPTEGENDILGFTPDGEIVTVSTIGRPYGADVWSDDGKQLATVSSESSGDLWQLKGTRLTSISDYSTRSIDLDPALWFAALCRISDRPFTDAERAQVERDGGRTDPPCRA